MKLSAGVPFNTRWLFSLVLIVLIGCGAFLRFSDLSAPLLDFHPTRQLFGAIKARGLYYQTLSNVPAWQKDLAVRQYDNEATIEPPLLEHLTARLYVLFGEQTAIPRAISASFWLLGGLFLFLLAKNLAGSPVGAALSLAFYLLLPYAVTASRAFQPDPLMVLMLLVFWWSIENWGRHLSWKWAAIAGLSGGLAIFIKFPAVFFVIGPALGTILGRMSILKALKSPQTWLILLLGVLPPSAYLFYGTYMNGFLGQQFGSRFYPELWGSPYFYLRWYLKLEDITSIFWIALSLLGWVVFNTRSARIFFGALWGAYLIFGMTFAHHISSHDYYSLPLIPILALGLAPLAVMILPAFKSLPGLLHRKPAQYFVVLLLLGATLLYTVNQYILQRTNDYRPEAAFWAQVGNAVGHQPGVLALTTDYGYPLAYYGWQNSSPWPASVEIKKFSDTFAHLAANKDYFLITDFAEYNLQPDLQKRLTETYPILVQDRTFILFDLAHPKK